MLPTISPLLLLTVYAGLSLGIKTTKSNNADYMDYCQIFCDDDLIHSACRGKGNGSRCPTNDCIELELVYQWREKVLELHNTIRNNVAIGNESRGGNSEASNMLALSYDMELEYLAACWAKNCSYKYDPCVRTHLNEPVGQNIFKGFFKTYIPTETILETWYEQIKWCSYDLIDRFTSNSSYFRRYRHFTQLINARTYRVGCGASSDINNENVFVVCNYLTAGNIEDSEIYMRGAPASQCPPHQEPNKKYRGLCGEEIVPLQARRRGEIPNNSHRSSAPLFVLLPVYVILLFH